MHHVAITTLFSEILRTRDGEFRRSAFVPGSHGYGTGTGSASGKDRPILIAVFQRGAADGISMVAPFGDRNYASARPQIAVPAPRNGAADAAIDLDGFFGFHPSLSPLKSIYDEGHLAVVHAVGSPDNTRSHFDAQDYMEAGAPGNKGVADGWLNRYLQGSPKSGCQRAFVRSPWTPRCRAP